LEKGKRGIRMGRPKGSDIKERMEHLGDRKFNGKKYELYHHETYGTKERAEKDANYYRNKGGLARIVHRGKGKYSIYVR
jgi:hypothetical protein